MFHVPALTPDLKRVLAVIRDAGGRPMLVGGFVRDAILGAVSKDIDVEVYGIADPGVLAAALTVVGPVAEAGKAFGVLKVRAGETDVDVSLPRRESKTGAGHRGFAVIECRRFGECIGDDAGIGKKAIAGAERIFDGHGVLPDRPDEAAAEAWLLKVRREFYA